MSYYTSDHFDAKSKSSSHRTLNKPSKKSESTILRDLEEPDTTGFSEGVSDFQSESKTVERAIIAIAVYLVSGGIIWRLWMDDWTLIDSLYFTVVTFTTIGYGDLYPVEKGQRIFGIIFVLVGIIILGYVALGIVFNNLFKSLQDAISDSKKKTQEDIFKKLTNDDQFLEDDSYSLRKEVFNTFISNLPLIIPLVFAAFMIGYVEEWSFATSLYYFFITATTVGYGDVTPKSQSMRLFAVIYLPLCVSFTANLFSQLTGVYFEKKARQNEREFLHRRMTLNDFQKMDVGGDGADGAVTYDEFLAFMLVTMGKVDEEDIKALEVLYQKLDVDHDGSLKKKDLIEMAYRDSDRMKPKRKSNRKSTSTVVNYDYVLS